MSASNLTARHWTKESVLARMHQLRASGVPTGKLWRADASLLRAAVRLFGSWRNALDAIGFPTSRKPWTKESVIEAIRSRKPNRGRIRLNQRLVSAAERLFGSTQAALTAAGIDRRVAVLRQRTWNRQTIIAALREYAAQGASCHLGWKRDPPLWVAARRVFGTWRAAKTAAGLLNLSSPPFSSDEALERLRLLMSGENPAVAARNERLRAAIRRHFGSWREGLRRVGVMLPARRRWNQRVVKEEILRLRDAGALSRAWRDASSLFTAAVRHFGSWSEALRACDLPCRQQVRWSRERVLSMLQESAAKGVFSIGKARGSLQRAVVKFFGGAKAAWAAAGFPELPRKWNPTRVIEAVQDGYRMGHRIDRPGLGDPSLAEAARRYFGTWRKGVEAAGLARRLAKPRLVRPWTREYVIAWIREVRSGPKRQSVKMPSPVYRNASRLFGGWNATLTSAGLPIVRRRWTVEKVLTAIRERHADGVSLTTAAMRDNSGLLAAAVRLLGSWRRAIEASGVAWSNEAQAHSKQRKQHVAGRRDQGNRKTGKRSRKSRRGDRATRRP